jgi:hypothetical protein
MIESLIIRMMNRKLSIPKMMNLQEMFQFGIKNNEYYEVSSVLTRHFKVAFKWETNGKKKTLSKGKAELSYD